MTVAGATSPYGDDDVWRFVVPANAAMAFEARSYTDAGDPSSCNNLFGDTRIFLEATGREVTTAGVRELAFGDDIGDRVYCSRISLSLPMRQTETAYFLRVQGFEDFVATNYLVDLRLWPVRPTVEIEPNDLRAVATATGLRGRGLVTVSGRTSPERDDDVFSFVVPANESLVFSARTYSDLGAPWSCDSDRTDTHLYLEDDWGIAIAENGDIDLARDVWCSELWNVVLPVAENDTTYWIRVQGYEDRADATYLMDVALD